MANKRCLFAIFAGVFVFSSNLFADRLDDIVAEINFVRTRPKEYALERLTPRLKNYKGNDYYRSSTEIISTREGAAACIECIEVLKKQKPLCPLTMDAFLCKSAAMHMRDQSETGTVGHEGSDGSHSYDRIERAGFKGNPVGENLSYGATNPIDIVANLMIDDGVPDRGHRENFLEPRYDRVGVSYAQGKKVAYGALCVIDLGGSGQGGQTAEAPRQSAGKKREKRVQQSPEPSKKSVGKSTSGNDVGSRDARPDGMGYYDYNGYADGSADILEDILAEINYVRTRPKEYALKRLTPMLKKYKGLDYYQNDSLVITTQEGAVACKECIAVLKKQKPLAPLTMDDLLCRAATMHMEDQSETGQIGHEGSDGSHSYDRIKKAGFRGSMTGENIAYGCFNPVEIVTTLLIDDGMPDRGHRDNFLNPDYDRVGVAYAQGYNAAYGSVCVIDLGKEGGGNDIEGSDYDYGNYGSTDYSD